MWLSNNMNSKQEFTKAGFSVIETEESENKLLCFIKKNYPSVIKDNEINLIELKNILGIPLDEKVNGYGLNFVGRNFARAKYAQKTDKELRLNRSLSVAEMTTQNLVLKGDNLDSLKILKNHYSNKIKCIYIDPPYNTTSDEFIYPDKFDKEETEVLGFQNLSEDGYARMDFSFKTKKSHNGWLAFMYPRLLLARDLLSNDGVIFISIDDNEQANLKLLCDEIFGEENFFTTLIRRAMHTVRNTSKDFNKHADFVLVYAKNKSWFESNPKNFIRQIVDKEGNYTLNDNDDRGAYKLDPLYARNYATPYKFTFKNGRIWQAPEGSYPRYSEETLEWMEDENRLEFSGNEIKAKRYLKEVQEGQPPNTILSAEDVAFNKEGTSELRNVLDADKVFSQPKPIKLIKYLMLLLRDKDSTILDFFAGSGTTGHAVMQLNAEDGGNRKFILCQIDEPINKDKPAYKFCKDNKLPPVISSITIERLKRAGEKIAKEMEEKNKSQEGKIDFDNLGLEQNQNQKSKSDLGFKVFDSVEAPKLQLDEKNNILMPENKIDALSRIYNMIFTIGLDEPSQVPEEVVKDCIYKIGNHYYLTNSEEISKEDYAKTIKNALSNSSNSSDSATVATNQGTGKVFIDGWTASLNGTLQNYKEDVKIVF